MAKGSCSIDQCERQHHARGWCKMHYRRWVKTGDPLGLRRQTSGSGTVVNGYRFIYAPTHPLMRGSKRTQLGEHRAVLYERIGPDSHPCHWCGAPLSWDDQLHIDPDTALVVDHVDANPLNNAPSNLVASCNSCNTKRRNGVRLTSPLS